MDSNSNSFNEWMVAARMWCDKAGDNTMRGILINLEAAHAHDRLTSLRDDFAGRAMQSIFAGEGARMVADRDARYDETNWVEVVASNAYEMADAMLAERNKTHEEPTCPN